MTVVLSSDAEADLVDGFWFYEHQQTGWGSYFRSSIVADLESLAILGGIHAKQHGYHRGLSKRFPFVIYYSVEQESITVVAELDARRSPLWIRRRLRKDSIESPTRNRRNVPPSLRGSRTGSKMEWTVAG